mmetsp:Transcript_37368/g.54696  ORF Transcript_37368/g.54696 Transcript_37368/m.54696 type:complete len:190 (+) Transcript_37368:86-655(+)
MPKMYHQWAAKAALITTTACLLMLPGAASWLSRETTATAWSNRGGPRFAVAALPRGGETGVATETRTDDYNVTPEDLDTTGRDELRLCRGGEIIDPHLHIAPWFDNGGGARCGTGGEQRLDWIAVQPPIRGWGSPTTSTRRFIPSRRRAGGRVFCLASLNTTHDDWDEHREFEMDRLRMYLAKDGGPGG